MYIIPIHEQLYRDIDIYICVCVDNQVIIYLIFKGSNMGQAPGSYSALLDHARPFAAWWRPEHVRAMSDTPPLPCPSNDLGPLRLGFALEAAGFSGGECYGAACCDLRCLIL